MLTEARAKNETLVGSHKKDQHSGSELKVMFPHDSERKVLHFDEFSTLSVISLKLGKRIPCNTLDRLIFISYNWLISISRQEVEMITTEKMPTSDRILSEALTLFSVHGYDGVSVEEIARSVGIKASSIYKHFTSKQQIFDAIMSMMQKNYSEKQHWLKIPEGEEEVIRFYKNITIEQLYEIGETLFLYYLEDEKEIKFRHLLTIGQYSDKKNACMLYNRYFLEPLEFQTKIFQSLIDAKIVYNGKAHIMALHFFSPITVLMTSCEHGVISKDQALNELFNHMKQFNDLYYI